MTDRHADHPILPLFLDRWSPRAFADRPIGDAALLPLFEAARWSPSSFNAQPWRFVYARRGDEHWESFFSAIMPFNQVWVANASALVFVLSDTMMTMEGERTASYSHSFDAGAAWMALALQAAHMGLAVHAMGGFDGDLARKAINAPDDFRIEAAIAIGYPGDKAQLPEKLREREVKSGRRPLGETLYSGPIPQ